MLPEDLGRVMAAVILVAGGAMPAVDLRSAPKDLQVYDVVFNPVQTRLLFLRLPMD